MATDPVALMQFYLTKLQVEFPIGEIIFGAPMTFFLGTPNLPLALTLPLFRIFMTETNWEQHGPQRGNNFDSSRDPDILQFRCDYPISSTLGTNNDGTPTVPVNAIEQRYLSDSFRIARVITLQANSNAGGQIEGIHRLKIRYPMVSSPIKEDLSKISLYFEGQWGYRKNRELA